MAPHPDFDPTDAEATDSPGRGRTDLEAVRREVVLGAAPDAVWAELATGDALAGWLADEVDLGEVAPGVTGTVRDGGGPERPVRVDEVVEGRRLGLTWRDADDRETVVEITLAPEGEGEGEGEGDGLDGEREELPAARTRIVVVEVPVATLARVAPAAARILSTAPPAGGTGPFAAAGPRGRAPGRAGWTGTGAARPVAGVR